MAPSDRGSGRAAERVERAAKGASRGSSSRVRAAEAKPEPPAASQRRPRQSPAPALAREPAPASPRAGGRASAASADEGSVLTARFEAVFSQITSRLDQGDYVAEHCSMLVEIARISAATSCPDSLRARALAALLRFGRRTEGEAPCRRGVLEMMNQCSARGLKR